MKRNLSKPALLLIIPLILMIFFGGIIYIQRSNRKIAYQQTYDSLVLEVNETLLEVEYGDPFDEKAFIKSYEGELSNHALVHTDKVGESDLVYTLKAEDSYGETVTRDYTYKLKVVDTHPAEIILENDVVRIYEDDEIDLNDNVMNVEDVVDGPLEYSEELKDNTYTFETDLDTSTAGEYTVTVKAKDKNGNESTKEFRVFVDEYTSEAYVSQSAYPYYIRINRAQNVVTIYSQDASGNYTIPFKAFVCSTGDATPLGTYQTSEKYRWRLLFGNVYGQYATRIVGDILFHSVPYYTMNMNDLEYEEYNKLGTAASLGCVRLCVRDVKWIYDNCPLGTTVEFYDDNSSPGPLGKPTPLKIDVNSPNRGWDPTDPDPGNPW